MHDCGCLQCEVKQVHDCSTTFVEEWRGDFEKRYCLVPYQSVRFCGCCTTKVKSVLYYTIFPELPCGQSWYSTRPSHIVWLTGTVAAVSCFGHDRFLPLSMCTVVSIAD